MQSQQPGSLGKRNICSVWGRLLQEIQPHSTPARLSQVVFSAAQALQFSGRKLWKSFGQHPIPKYRFLCPLPLYSCVGSFTPPASGSKALVKGQVSKLPALICNAQKALANPTCACFYPAQSTAESLQHSVTFRASVCGPFQASLPHLLRKAEARVMLGVLCQKKVASRELFQAGNPLRT